MEPEIVQVKAFTIHGLARRVGCHETNTACPALWEAYVPLMLQNPPEPDKTYGACYGFEAPDEKYPKGSFQYMAGMEKSEAFSEEGFEDIEIQAGTFAKFIYQGLIGAIGEMIGKIWSEWLPTNGKWKHRVVPDFEIYGNDFNPDDGVTQIFIPIDPA